MSAELIAILATTAFQLSGLVALGTMLYRIGRILDRMDTKMNADDAALYLQGRKILQILEETRDDR